MQGPREPGLCVKFLQQQVAGAGQGPAHLRSPRASFSEISLAGVSTLQRTHAHMHTRANQLNAGQVMNCCSMGFPDASFDAVIDKALLDSLLCGENSTVNTGKYVGTVARLLKPGGAFIIVSFGTPENRLSYLEGDYGWQVTVHSIPKPTINTAGLPEVNSSDPNQQHVRCVCARACVNALHCAPHPLPLFYPPLPLRLSTCTLQKRRHRNDFYLLLFETKKGAGRPRPPAALTFPAAAFAAGLPPRLRWHPLGG